MKAIENISARLENILLKGLETADKKVQVKLFNSSVSVYHVEDTVFVHYQHLKTFANKNEVNFYEIKSSESYYLFDSIKSIVEDLDNYGTDAGKQDALKIYSSILSFCKEIGFGCKDFETAISKLK